MKKRIINYIVLIASFILVIGPIISNIYWLLIGNNLEDKQSIPLLLQIEFLIFIVILILYTVIYEMIQFKKNR